MVLVVLPLNCDVELVGLLPLAEGVGGVGRDDTFIVFAGLYDEFPVSEELSHVATLHY